MGIRDTLAEDLLELGGKIKAEGNRRLSDVSDSSRDGSVGSPSVVNERAHQKRMKKLEVKAAEERQKEKEEEERRVKRAVEEERRKKVEEEERKKEEEKRKRVEEEEHRLAREVE